MEFTDVVMKRRAVRRFEDGGVDREVIERIARLAQRTPSAGFSQGQRLVVVTEPVRRREVARICGEEEYEPDFGPWISECAAQFVPCVSEAIYHRRYQEPDKVEEDGSEIEWPVPFWWVDIGATMQNIMLAAVNEGLGCGFVGPEIEPLRAYLGIPEEFVPIGVMPLGPAAPGRAVTQPQAGLGAAGPVRSLGVLGLARLSPTAAGRSWPGPQTSAPQNSGRCRGPGSDDRVGGEGGQRRR